MGRLGRALIGAGALSVLFTRAASACECAAILSPKDARRQADLVFVGTVSKVVAGGRPVAHVFDPRARGRGAATVTFQVVSGWKGTTASELVLLTGPDSCAAPFRRGDTYLVFGRGPEGQATTNLCAGNRLMEPAERGQKMADVIKELGRPKYTVRRTASPSPAPRR